MGWDWNGFAYEIHDLFTTSYAESQRNMYGDLVSILGNSIQIIRSEIGSVRGEIDSVFSQYLNQGTANSGWLSDEFSNKVQKHRDELNRLLTKMADSIGELTGKRSEAESEYEYWCEVCEREDEEKREYKP